MQRGPWGPLGTSCGLLQGLTGLLGSLWVASGSRLGASRARDVEMLVRAPPLGPLLGRSWGALELSGESPGPLGRTTRALRARLGSSKPKSLTSSQFRLSYPVIEHSMKSVDKVDRAETNIRQGRSTEPERQRCRDATTTTMRPVGSGNAFSSPPISSYHVLPPPVPTCSYLLLSAPTCSYLPLPPPASCH